MFYRSTLAIALFVISAVMALPGCAKKKHSAVRSLPAAPAMRPATPVLSTEMGLASWYGHPYHGRAAANGEIYDMEKLTAAHRTLPFNTWVRVTNLLNQKAVDVRIIDRGPFIDGRVIDLSHAAAQVIGLIGPGIAQVRIDIIAPPPPFAAVSTLYAVQVAAFQERERAERYRIVLEKQYGTARIVWHDGKPALWRVLVGAESTVDAASLLARRLQSEVGSGFVVRLDDPASTPALGTR